MSVVVETSEPFLEIEREVRKLERLLNRETMDVEILQETLDTEPMSQSMERSGSVPA
jgi:predicted RNase H-like nuclease (RuvC/YqgF family)